MLLFYAFVFAAAAAGAGNLFKTGHGEYENIIYGRRQAV